MNIHSTHTLISLRQIAQDAIAQLIEMDARMELTLLLMNIERDLEKMEQNVTPPNATVAIK